MNNYIIDGIINSKTKKPDLESSNRLGKRVGIDKNTILKDESLTMKNIDEEVYIKTSPVVNYFFDNDDIYVETRNRIQTSCNRLIMRCIC